jgi:hypothetical protein
MQTFSSRERERRKREKRAEKASRRDERRAMKKKNKNEAANPDSPAVSTETDQLESIEPEEKK